MPSFFELFNIINEAKMTPDMLRKGQTPAPVAPPATKPVQVQPLAVPQAATPAPQAPKSQVMAPPVVPPGTQPSLEELAKWRRAGYSFDGTKYVDRNELETPSGSSGQGRKRNGIRPGAKSRRMKDYGTHLDQKKDRDSGDPFADYAKERPDLKEALRIIGGKMNTIKAGYADQGGKWANKTDVKDRPVYVKELLPNANDPERIGPTGAGRLGKATGVDTVTSGARQMIEALKFLRSKKEIFWLPESPEPTLDSRIVASNTKVGGYYHDLMKSDHPLAALAAQVDNNVIHRLRGKTLTPNDLAAAVVQGLQNDERGKQMLANAMAAGGDTMPIMTVKKMLNLYVKKAMGQLFQPVKGPDGQISAIQVLANSEAGDKEDVAAKPGGGMRYKSNKDTVLRQGIKPIAGVPQNLTDELTKALSQYDHVLSVDTGDSGDTEHAGPNTKKAAEEVLRITTQIRRSLKIGAKDYSAEDMEQIQGIEDEMHQILSGKTESVKMESWTQYSDLMDSLYE